MKKVSVILPIYNVSQYLRECLDSVINQTLQELEIICVNDGSTDNSLEIIQEYAQKDKRIVVITGPNGGYGRAMNKGLDHATGEYIGIVEPDDYVSLEMFGELYAIATKNNLDFVKADFYRFKRDDSGKEDRQYEFLDKTKAHYYKLLNPSQNPDTIRFTMNTWSGIYKREFIEKYHIRHNETPGASFQDNGFFWQTFIYATRAMLVNKPYYCNRRDNPNSSVKSKEKVYCMNVEYDHIRNILMQDQKIWERFKYIYWWKKYHNYMFTYNRIDEMHRKEYLQRMRAEFQRAMQKNELSQDVFSDLEWRKIQALIKNVASYRKMLKTAKLVEKLSPYVPRFMKKIVLRMIARR